MMINGNAPFLGSNQMIADCMMDSSISYLNHLPVYSLESSLPVIWHLWKTVWFHVENMIVYMIRVWLVEMASVRCPILIYFDQKKKTQQKTIGSIEGQIMPWLPIFKIYRQRTFKRKDLRSSVFNLFSS